MTTNTDRVMFTIVSVSGNNLQDKGHEGRKAGIGVDKQVNTDYVLICCIVERTQS